MTHRRPTADDAERWCQDLGFVRSLARRLVADAHHADDVAQEAWLLALRGPAPRAGFRAWITAIVRNVVTSQHRQAAARTKHEAAAVGCDDDEDPRTTIARLEAHELLVATVRALDEPYRRAIVQRYFEGLSPRAMAARNGTPVRTVHTHLQRALTQLRARLADRDPRGSAVLLVAGLPAGGTATAAATLLVMTTKTKCAWFGAVAVLLAAFAVFDGWLPDSGPVAPAPPPTEPARVVAAAKAATEAPADRHLVATAPADSPAAAAGGAEPWPVDGVVLDLAGRPVVGVAVTLTGFGQQQPAASAVTTAGGAFHFSLPAVSGGHVDVDDAGWTAVYRPVLWGNRDVGDLTVVAAAAAAVSGVVVDDAGTPLAGARVSVSGDLPPRAQFARSLERAVVGEWAVDTRADGTFELPRVPLLAAMQAHASRTGYRSAHAPLHLRGPLRLVLARAPVLVGRVVDEQGRPVEAAVFCHPAGAMSGPDGRFELDVANVSSPWLVAAVQGHLPARLRCEGGPPTEPSSWPMPLELRLGGAALAIGGRALAGDGTPLPSPSVRVLDAECLVPGNDMSSIEFLARVSSRVTAMGAEFMESGRAAAAPGSFAVGGLQDRSYRLLLEHRPTLQWLESAPIRAGTHDVELRLPAEPMWPPIGGLVVDRRGAAVAGASVWIERPDPAGGAARSTDAIATGTDGGFACGTLARAACTLCVQTPGIAHATRFDLERLGDVKRLRIVAPVRTSARIHSQHDADAAVFLDAMDQPIAVTITHGDSAWGAFEVALAAGQSEVVTVPDHATMLVLRRRGMEVARLRVDLVPGEVHVLRP